MSFRYARETIERSRHEASRLLVLYDRLNVFILRVRHWRVHVVETETGETLVNIEMKITVRDLVKYEIFSTVDTCCVQFSASRTILMNSSERLTSISNVLCNYGEENSVLKDCSPKGNNYCCIYCA